MTNSSTASTRRWWRRNIRSWRRFITSSNGATTIWKSCLNRPLLLPLVHQTSRLSSLTQEYGSSGRWHWRPTSVKRNCRLSRSYFSNVFFFSTFWPHYLTRPPLFGGIWRNATPLKKTVPKCSDVEQDHALTDKCRYNGISVIKSSPVISRNSYRYKFCSLSHHLAIMPMSYYATPNLIHHFRFGGFWEGL